ncbi:LysR family transcriptional regulator [uncultured Amphritea sp.]|uniref:LysR family transcriptional regulator n=1 Tax=uncultured Amphritea sp. TaxID=981605 RepID=UPI00261B0F82|nr:LysR family transcriptional regulator [uncultured Amphritea sp.]
MNNNELIPLLTEMAIFVAVAEEQNFTKAAKKLAMATSSVSRSIHRLEQSLNIKLLERTTRQVRLSMAGQDVYQQCKHMLESAKAAIQAAESTQDVTTGILSIAAPKAFAKQILSPLIFDFCELYPGIKIKLNVTDRFIHPISEDVDVIFRLTQQPLEGLISKTLTHSALVMCASPAYLENAGTPTHPHDLVHHQCITLGEEACDDDWTFTKAHQKVTIKTNQRFAANHSEIRKAAALRSMGITIFPDFAAQQEMQSGALIQVLPDWHVSGNYQGQVILQYAQSRFIPNQIRAFVDYMVTEFSHHNHPEKRSK